MKQLHLMICLAMLCTFPFRQADAQIKEFANLKRYQSANEALPEPGKKEKRVVFLGNSITDSWPESFFEGKPYINRGISGQTTPQMLIRFRQDVIYLKPSLVIILAGTNDLAGNTGPSTIEMITNNIESMCELAKANHIKVILCSVLPATIFPWRKEVGNPAERIIELNGWIQEYARENGHYYLDYYSSMVNGEKGLKNEYAADAVHPNEKGYEVMATLVEKAIGEVLGRKAK